MKIYVFIFVTFCLFSCSTKSKKFQNEEKPSFLYIYDFEKQDGPVDSLAVFDSGYEKSLDYYKSFDTLNKKVDGSVSISIFNLNKQKFAYIADTSTIRIYKWNNSKFEQIINIPQELGMNVQRNFIDFNTDGYKDVIIELVSGGSYGVEYICLFYEPMNKTLLYDFKNELRNIELDIPNKKITSSSRIVNNVFEIGKNNFVLKEQIIDLLFTTGNEKFENKIEVTKYSNLGKVTSIDTIERKY